MLLKDESQPVKRGDEWVGLYDAIDQDLPIVVL